MQPKVESLSRGMRFAPGIVLGLAARAEVTMSTSRMPGWNRWPDSSSATGCLRLSPSRSGRRDSGSQVGEGMESAQARRRTLASLSSGADILKHFPMLPITHRSEGRRRERPALPHDYPRSRAA